MVESLNSRIDAVLPFSDFFPLVRGVQMRPHRVGLSALLLSLAALGLSAPVSAQQSSLMGTVTDAESGAPVPQASVRLLDAAGTETLTNNAGRFIFQIPAG